MNKCFVMLFSLCLAASCTQAPSSPRTDVTLRLCAGKATRSLLPDEQLISDLNLFIYTQEGLLEERRYLSERLLQGSHSELVLRTSLLRGVPYTLLACANLGYELPPLPLEELSYPDEYTHGMPLSLLTRRTIPEDTDSVIDLELERAMARVDLQLDRSALQGDVALEIESVHVGGCPASVSLFQESRALGKDDIFASGFFLDSGQSQPLNHDGDGGKSGTVSLYLLENCQGDLLPEDTPEEDKVLTDSYFSAVCSYIELWASYHSGSRHTPPGEHLAYRFYLGEGPGNFDVCRNTVYRITVRPEGDGLGTDNWRLDKTCLAEF